MNDRILERGYVCVVVLPIITLAAGFALWQFLNNRSLWFDEATLALNIFDRSFAELLRPLDHNQVAPILYLQITKLFSLLTPHTEYGLRLFPLISFWLSIALFYRSLRKLFKDAFPLVLALSLFAFNPTLIYYSSELKQYMSDVLVSTIFLYLLLSDSKLSGFRFFGLAFAGVGAVFLSNIAPVVLLASGLYLAAESISNRNKKELYRTIEVGALWLASFGVYYWLFVYNHPAREYMLTYWEGEGAFTPWNVFSKDFFRYWGEMIIVLEQKTFQGARFLIVLAFGLLLTGLLSLLRQKKIGLALLLFSPVLIHFFLSALQLYPISKRMVLYLLPFLIIAATTGIHAIMKGLPQFPGNWLSKAGVVLIPLAALIVLMSYIPREQQETKKSLLYISEHALPGQTLAMSHGAGPAFEYYKQTGLFDADHFDQVIIGSWLWGGSDEVFYNQLIGLEGGFWLLLSHFGSYEKKVFLDRLASAGYAPEKVFNATGTHAYYFPDPDQ